MRHLTAPLKIGPVPSIARKILATLLIFIISLPVFANTFPVTNTNDAGPGSLRQAILDANAAGPGPHSIAFNVYGQITILSSLPAITKSNLTVDGENKITINSPGTNGIINPFDIRANNVAIRNFKLTNNGDADVIIRNNTTGVVVENISTSSNTGNYLNSLVYVEGNSSNLTLRKLWSTDLEPCINGAPSIGRGIYFTGGTQTNLVMDSIFLTTANNTRGCEAIVFRDASVNGLVFTNSSISGFQNGIVLDNTGGPVETANNILLRNVTLDSLTTGVSLGFYSDFVNTNIQLKRVTIELNTIGADDDGDHPIRFDNTTNGITLDTVRLTESDIYFVWFNGAASNITINHSVMENTVPGLYGGSQFIRFESTASNVNISNTILNADKPGNTDDADMGIVFIGATTDVTLDNLTLNEFDSDGINVSAASTNFQLTNSIFTNNFDGIEFYNNVARSNVDIINSSFKGAAGARSGIVVNAANAVSDIDLVGDTVYNVGNGIWIHGGSSVTDISITGCVVHDNTGVGVVVDQPDKVLITQNSIYNNATLGIDLVNTGNCGYEGVNRPVLVSSTSLGGGQYQLVINLPAIVPTGYTVDIYANDPATSASSGQYFVTSLTGLSSGNNTRTVTYNTGPGATGVGFWTATLRIPANNCGTSEFSNKLSIGIKAPACITNGIVAWYRADMGVNGMNWGDISGNANHMIGFGDPDDTTGLINFNKAIYYDGNDDHRAPATAGVTTAYTMMGLAKLEGSQNGRVFSSTTGNKLFGWHGGYNDRLFIEGWINSNTNPITSYTKLYSIKRANTGGGPYEFKGNGVLLNSGTASDGSAWTLNVGAVNGAEPSKVLVPEVFVYNRDLTPDEIRRLESYMALKYGITLNNGATDYVASDGTTVMWSASTNTPYVKHITGIGKDDCTLLHQKQSLSADTGLVTIALGNSIAVSNAANTNAVTTDKTFLVFGDNGAAVSYSTAVTGTYVTQRMARVFKVQKSASWADQNITLRVKGTSSNNYLLISTDPTFASISQELPLNAAGEVTLNSSLLANGIYFTLGALIKAPGNVTAGVALWLRADDGTASGAVWNDFSGNGNGATQAVAANQAAVLPVGINFNPMLKFDGANDYLSSPSLFTSLGVNNVQIYAVSITDNLQNQNLFGEFVSNGQYVHAHVPYTDGILYWDAPYGFRAQGAWGGQLGTPYLWSFLRSPSAMSATRNRISVATYAAAMSNIAGTNSPFVVGAVANGAGPLNGKIAELIVYNNSAATTATQRQQIESYLAIKYGITLPVDYLASDGTTKMWNAVTNTGYNLSITGIGRDDLSALNQKQSKSVDAGYVTMALGNTIALSNAANASTIGTDKSFFVTGDNGAAKIFNRTVTGITGVSIALARTWKVQKTNWADQAITLATDSTLPAPQYLLISTDATFGAGDVALPITNRSITVNTSQLPDGAFFTFANAFKAPGNVTAGIAAWWRADVEASATSWSDYSGNGKTLTPPSVAAQPSLLPVNINYQPAVKFHPTASLNSASLFGTASTNNIAIFAVSAADGAGGNSTGSGLFSEYVSNGDRIAAWAPYGNGYIYWYPPLGWAVNSATPLVAYANPRFNILGFTKTPAQLNILFNNTTVGTANGTFTGINGNNQTFILGAFNGPDWFNGRIAEFVVYNNSSAMTNNDRLKIQSYLALKYGITLSPAAPTDYLASDGTIKMWTAADNTGLGRRITGIGRDDSSALYQKQSVSIDTGIVTIAVGNAVAASNLGNTSTITNDKSFIVFSDDGTTASYATPVTGVTGVNTRMTRIFKVDKTNWADQNITLKLNGGNAQTSLLVSTDAVFDGSDTKYVLNADSTITLNSSILADGVYFTFATNIKGPNGVNKGINFWLRADDGNTSGASWKDYAGYGHQALQSVVAGQPATDAKAINFNYGLKFDGTDDFLDINNTTRLNPDSSTIFAVASGSGFATGRELVSSGALAAANGVEFRVVSPSILQYLQANGSTIQGVNGISTYVDNRPYIFSGTKSSLANGTKLYQNYKSDNQGTVNIITNNANFVSIGSRINAGRGISWLGNISEVIVYDRVLTDAERQLVDSYLGLKYGITLNNGTTNYLASDNSVYWTADATYKSRITGIGRDDSTALNTKQSLSVDTGFVTLALGAGVPLTNEINSNTITNNKSFFAFGDNGLSASNFTVAFSGSTHNVTRRMARVWKVQKTNWADQNITLKIKPIGIDNYLLIGSDPTFATYSQELPVSADGTITLSSALFSSPNIYFTFGAPLKSPGGVPGHAFWVRADIGTSSIADNTKISEWSDFSAFANNAVQATAANQPTLLDNGTNNINFNPVVRFNGSPTGMTAASILKTGTYTGAAAFVVNSQVTPTNALIWTEPTAPAGTAFSLHATWGDNVVYWDPPYSANRLTYNAGDVNNQSILWTATSDISLAANRQSIFKNGMNVSNGNGNGQYTGSNSAFSLGMNAGANNYNGRIGEVIIYTNALTTLQQQQVNTYLALKYGITLNNGNTNYIATDGTTTVWDATANAAHKKNIAGIGRDDEEALRQKQSRSINTGFQVTIGLGSIDSTNSANPNDFTADKSYLVWSDDSTSTAFVTAVSGHPTVNYRMTRVWKAQETGTVGNVMVAIPANVIPSSFSSVNLIISADAAFDGSDTYYPLTQTAINGVNYYTASVDLTNNQFFSFGALVAAPGGVLGEALWVKADAGVQANGSSQIEQWFDQSGSGGIVTELRATSLTHTDPIVASADIIHVPNAINFNPSLDFSGVLNKSLKGNANVDWNSTPSTVFGVSIVEGAMTGSGAFGGIFDGLADWTANDGGSGGMGLSASATAYNLDGGGCSPAVSTSPTTGIPRAVRGMYATAGNGLGASIAVNGRTEGTSAVATCLNYATTFFEVGGRTAGTAGFDGRIFNGKIPEVIVYRSVLTAADNNKVESYLAVKYGLTLDQTAPTSYVSSNASVTWDAAVNGIYKNNIGGIGRDDFSALLQKQSRSVNPGLQVTIGLGALDSTNLANVNTFAANNSFLTWGDDNAAVTFKTVVTGNSAVNTRMARIWKVQETGTVGQVEVAFPYDALPNPRQSYLVVSSDAAIDNADTYIPLYDITINGKRYWAAKTDFTTGQYFTIAAFIKSPGGVGVTSLWVRADKGIQNNTDGTPVDVWVDYGNEVNNASQTNAAIQPVYQQNITDNINYNPVVKFNGTDQFLNLDVTKLPTGTAARTLVGVGSLTNTTTNHYILGYGTAGNNLGNGLISLPNGVGGIIGYGNDVITAAGFWQLNVPNELFGTWAGAGGQASLYSKAAAVATPANKPWNTGTGGARIGASPWGEFWTGPISEVIAFDRVLTTDERLRVSTYLAIRHGYTINQTVANNYLNTSSAVIWDGTANAAYKNNIAGIGRDDIEGLDQKQSKSINTGAVVAIGLGTALATDNLSNSNTFGTDLSYFIWGSNSAALTTSGTDLPALFSQRLTQEWKVSLSNFNNQSQPLAMVFDLAGITHSGVATSDFTLLIDTDGDGNFTTGTITEIPAGDYTGNKVSFSNVTGFTNNAVFTLAIGPQSLRLNAKAILQGAWNGSAMSTALKTAAVLPDTDPYAKNTTPSVTPNAASAQVVDWVLVELRDATNPAVVIESRAGFILSNGNIVDTNYTQPLTFYNAPAANYNVAIRHRNHLGVMSLNAVDFSTGTGTIDFTLNATATYGTNARKDLGGGVMGLWAGDVNGDGTVKHSAKLSDATVVANAVLAHSGNTTSSTTYTGFSNVYHIADVNLDARVYYGAAPSDHTIIVNNVKTHPANTFGLTSYIIKEQLP